MTDSIFTKIIKGEIPAYKIYEDDRVIAFLDIHPKTVGHTLVVPKQQVEFLWDLDEKTYQAVMRAAQLLAKHLRTILGARYVGSEVIGVDVPHAHYHLLPFNDVSELKRPVDAATGPDHQQLVALAEKLRI